MLSRCYKIFSWRRITINHTDLSARDLPAPVADIFEPNILPFCDLYTVGHILPQVSKTTRNIIYQANQLWAAYFKTYLNERFKTLESDSKLESDVFDPSHIRAEFIKFYREEINHFGLDAMKLRRLAIEGNLGELKSFQPALTLENLWIWHDVDHKGPIEWAKNQEVLDFYYKNIVVPEFSAPDSKELSVTKCSANNTTILFWDIMCNQTIETHIKEGADIHALSSCRWTVLNAAARYGRLVSINYLLQLPDFEIDDQAVWVAAAYNQPKVIDALCEKIDSVDHPITVCCVSDKYEFFNATDAYNETALHAGCRENYLTVVQCLVRHNANPNETNFLSSSHNFPITAFMTAGFNQSLDVAKFLLRHYFTESDNVCDITFMKEYYFTNDETVQSIKSDVRAQLSQLKTSDTFFPLVHYFESQKKVYLGFWKTEARMEEYVYAYILLNTTNLNEHLKKILATEAPLKRLTAKFIDVIKKIHDEISADLTADLAPEESFVFEASRFS